MNEAQDPALLPFLTLSAQDMAATLQPPRPVETALVQRVQELIGRLDVDLNQPLLADDE